MGLADGGVSHLIPCCPRSSGLPQKSFKLVWWCHQLLSGFLAKDNFPGVSRQSADKCGNETMPGDVNRSPGDFLNSI